MSKPPGEIPLPPGEGVGNGGSRGDSRGPVAAEIQAEIADHLATAAEKLQSQGIPTEEAHQKSAAKFGDPATIGRRCYWIKQGDALMFRTAIIVLLTLLCCALGLVAFSGYRSQRQMAEQMAALAAQLMLLAEQQRSAASKPAPSAEAKPLEITGQVYIGSPDKPSANAEVMICSVSDGEIVRRLRTGGDGAFQTGPLGAGDYCAIVKSAGRAVQSRPVYLYEGASDLHLPMDAAYYGGDVAIELSQPLPRTEVPGKYTISSRLYVFGLSTQCQPTRWTTVRPSPDHWPVYVYDADESPAKTIDLGERFRFSVGSERADLAKEPELSDYHFNFRISGNLIGVAKPPKALPAGRLHVFATIVSDVLPHDFSDVVKNDLGSPRVIMWMDHFYPFSIPLGAAWRAKLRNEHSITMGGPAFGSPEALERLPHDRSTPGEASAHVTIEDGRRTHLRVEIPSEIHAQIAQLVESVTSADEFVDRLQNDNPFFRHDIAITVLGTEPLKEDETTTSP